MKETWQKNWQKCKSWCQKNPLMAALLAGAALLVVMQIIRVAGQYRDLLRLAESLSAASAAG